MFFTSLLAGLAVGSIWFWLILVAAAIGITFFVEAESGGRATLILIATVAIMYWAFKVPVVPLIVKHPWKFLSWVGVYFAAGIVWGFFKWFIFVHKRMSLYRAARTLFLQENNVTELTPALMSELLRAIPYGISPAPPLASNCKGDIIRWMSYWPFSVLGTLLNDLVRHIWSSIYDFLTQTYDRIAAHVFRKYSADVKLAQQGNISPQETSHWKSDKRQATGVINTN